MMNEEQKQALIEFNSQELARYRKHKPGTDLDEMLVQTMEVALAALTQPASPAFKLPGGLIKAIEFYRQVKEQNPAIETGAWKDAHQWIISEALAAADAPHTAPIEPICATGGAEWVKCSDRMPESKPGTWSKEVAAVSELGDVFKLSAMGNYWQRSKSFIESGAEEITYWYPLPEDT